MTDNGRKVARKSRTVMSCDRCKSRKTKCNNPGICRIPMGIGRPQEADLVVPSVPGPCDYCSSIDAVCQIDIGKRRQRPYYFVSQEEYRNMQNILRYYLPDVDLTPSTLRSIASRCDEKQTRDGAQSSTNALSPAHPNVASKRGGRSQEAETLSAQGEEGVALQEIVHLHEDLGCMLADARGEYRYMGADSGISFNTAVRSLTTASPQAAKDMNVIPGLETVTLPVPGSKSTTVAQIMANLQLPERDVCLQCAARYFEEVHCLHWLYSSEQFHTRLEATYIDQEKTPTYSWVCSLYCIFALGALGTPLLDGSVGKPNAGDYLDMAKCLVPQVCDEADLDSVRAMILLALALQSNAFSNSAYLYTGMAIRIAFSLGLHLDKYSTSYDPVEKEHARRIWWSLDIFDQEIALRVGKPCMIGAPTGVSWQPPLPSEQILSPGPHMPPGYLQLSIALTQLTKSARDTLYIEPIAGGKKLSLPSFDAALSSLREWLACVPPYMSPTAPTAPLHKRPVAILHVRFWSVVILVSRPFLLCSLLRRTQLQGTSKLRYFEELSSVCVDAAEQSLNILKRMTEERLLSSILVADFCYALELLQVFLIAFALNKSEKHLSHTRNCLEVLQAMGSSGYCQKMLPEVLNQLKDWGILPEAFVNLSSLQELDTSLTDMEPGNEFYEMLFNANDTSDINAADIDFIDGATNDELLQQIMEMSEMPPAPAIFR